MPFGLCNAAQRLCRLMDQVIPSALRERVFVYLDDLLVVSPDFETHLQLLTSVAKCLEEAGLTINVDKLKFCLKELRYLGYIIGGGQSKPDAEKVETITRYKYLKTLTQVLSFMGAVGWYLRFIPDFASISDHSSKRSRRIEYFSFTLKQKQPLTT